MKTSRVLMLISAAMGIFILAQAQILAKLATLQPAVANGCSPQS